MAKQRVEEPVVASLDPNEMLAGGLKDDFRGVITEAVYCRWDYDGTTDDEGKPVEVLAARLTIQPEDEEEPFVQHWSAGDINAFVPSQDGKTPCDDDEVGPYAVRVGKRAGLNNNTNFAHLMSSILDSGEASKKFTRKQLTSGLDCLEGLDCHWNRVPQKKRSGLVDEEGGGKARDVLVVTEVFGYREDEGGKSKSKPNGKAGKPVSAKSKKDEEDDENEATEKSPLDSKLEDVVAEALEGGKTLKKGKLAKLVLDALAKDKDKAKGVKRVTEEDFLNGSDKWVYDEDEGTLTGIEADDE